MTVRVLPGRNFLFTDNIMEGDDEEDFMLAPRLDPREFRYLVAQLERGEGTGRLHWQGYVQFGRVLRLSALKKLHPTASWENARGDGASNTVYCTKTGPGGRVEGTEPWVLGEMQFKGKRNDIVAIRDEIRAGKRKIDLVEDDELVGTVVRLRHVYCDISELYEPVPRLTEVILHLGPTGCGKTKMVTSQYRGSRQFWRNPLSNGTVWFNRYDGQEIALLDEMKGAASHITLDMLLNLLDIGEVVQIPTKGGYVWWNPQTIYVTSQHIPSIWYNYVGREDDYNALRRRFTMVRQFTGPCTQRADGTWEYHFTEHRGAAAIRTLLPFAPQNRPHYFPGDSRV